VAKDLSSLESEIEATRERLSSTIDELVHRTHPKTIATRQATTMKAHFVDLETGQPRTENILKVAGGVIGVVVALVVIRKIVR
jgi:uncharacterized protein DUF3618